MKILRRKGTPLFDVFTGEGWYNHTKVLFEEKHNSVKILNGEHLAVKQKAEVRAFVINLLGKEKEHDPTQR